MNLRKNPLHDLFPWGLFSCHFPATALAKPVSCLEKAAPADSNQDGAAPGVENCAILSNSKDTEVLQIQPFIFCARQY
jgi:hypothetical protein